ncbi:MAG: stage 0 sporulation family protein [Chitinophagales bacterium]
MSCSGCSVAIAGGKPEGCGSHGNCATGGCNRLNTFDWLSHLPVPADQQFHIHEVSFKNGLRKGFFVNKNKLDVMTGDMVAVETESGYDVGKISLSGELVKLQMKKRKADIKGEYPKILRKAHTNDLQKLVEARSMEGATMLRSRVLARELKLEMKIGDVEFQGDKKKATFYYIADGRVDFRELIKLYAKEFKVKIDMRQIGARQEAGKIGGLGSCGRELCCSTWLQDFKSVSTNAARYQNLSINQTKLSGQCGRLKCCLNYELDTYLDALQAFPEADVLQTQQGEAHLVKRDIFKKTMVYEFRHGGKQYVLQLANVQEILEKNRRNEKPEGLETYSVAPEPAVEDVEFVDVTGHVSLKIIEKASQKRKQKDQRNRNQQQQNIPPQTTSQRPDNRNQHQQKRNQQDRNSQNRRDNNKNRDNRDKR